MNFPQLEQSHSSAEQWAMSDSEDGDSYHEEGFPSLQCDQDDEGSVDSLPDLVLSAATTLSQTTQVQIFNPNSYCRCAFTLLFYHVNIFHFQGCHYNYVTNFFIKWCFSGAAGSTGLDWQLRCRNRF